ncbi:MAG: PQQ-binding-like beta-propeller repeat protein [Streptosporangiaceae bacterium]
MRPRRLLTVAVTGVAVALVTAGGAAAADWPAYLNGPSHSSYNAGETAITTANAGSLVKKWDWYPAATTQSGQPSGLLASPTVVGGVVYQGANTGVFYAVNASTGKTIWSQNLGFVKGTTCGPLGIVSTATVINGTVYVAGGDGYLYALKASTGAVIWKSVIGIPSTTVNNYYDWSSPTVAGGNIYVGVSSNCDNPLIKGGLKEYSASTGALEHFYQSYPGHSVQASVWSSAAYGSNGVFITTGNGPGGAQESIIRLNPSTLAQEDYWEVPVSQRVPDSDFGGSPTLFTATIGGVSTPMVGACNKNGIYYAWMQNNLAAGPVWEDTVGKAYAHTNSECDAAAIWDGSRLYIAGNGATLGGTAYPGELQQVNPATGAYIWRTPLTTGPPDGSPTMDGAGVIAATVYQTGTGAGSEVLTLANASTGAVLHTITTGPDFGQPVFADGMMFVPTQNHGLQAYAP